MDNPMKTHGAFSWNELLTTDVANATAFYTALLGWKAEDASMPEHGIVYTMVKVGETPVGGIMAIPPAAKGMPPMWGSYVTVDDVDASARKAVELGGRIYKEPTDIPGVGRFCVIGDPQGAALNLIAYGSK